MGYEPTGANSLGGEGVALDSERWNENQEEGDGKGEDAERYCVVKPPGNEVQADNRKAQQGFDFAGSNRKQAMGLDQHLYGRDEMEEEGHASEVHTPAPRSVGRAENGGENSDTCSRV
jgi:hypothetical protein